MKKQKNLKKNRRLMMLSTTLTVSPHVVRFLLKNGSKSTTHLSAVATQPTPFLLAVLPPLLLRVRCCRTACNATTAARLGCER